MRARSVFPHYFLFVSAVVWLCVLYFVEVTLTETISSGYNLYCHMSLHMHYITHWTNDFTSLLIDNHSQIAV